MKRIEFIAPVSAMRGNLSGSQNLKYPTNDNKAYEGPVGEMNYARNYTPRFIGNKRAADGATYFGTKTSFASHLTVKSKHAMAVMGGVGAIISALYRTKTSTTYANLRAQWQALQGVGDTRTFRKYLTDGLRTMIDGKKASVVFAGPKPPVTIVSNWNGEGTPTVTIGSNTLVKFWDELATDGIYFTIDGQKGIAKDGWDFGEIITETDKNVLSLTTQTVTGTNYIKYGGKFVMYGTDFLSDQMDVDPNGVYNTTNEIPE